jgi:serine/threonine-protein kinase
MDSTRWSQVKEIFYAALDLPQAERHAFLRGKCSDDWLYEEIESLLEAHEKTERFIESPMFGSVKDFVKDEKESSLVGKLIGVYKIEKEIGRGGMGTVYLASRADEHYQKRVAVKLIKRGLGTDDIIRRFRHERQILAALDHPNITRLLDGGATENGLPYLVMDYVEGVPLNHYCNERQLTINERLKLFLQICSAVTYAHQNLIIHRDIKPSNIFVTSDGVPKLLDFGIAKLTTPDSPQTIERTATQAMTPEYASPEQILGEPVTTATDVYSLGVVLYELLTGHRPFKTRTNNPNEIARLITDSEPQKPSSVVTRGRKIGNRQLAAPSVSNQLRGDLDNIVLMAMRKEAERRYSSVEQFAADINRYLKGLPVIARQDTFGYRASKFIQRNKALVAAGAGIAISLIAGLAATKRQARIAQRQRNKAEHINEFLQKMLSSADPRALGKDVKVVEMLRLAAESIETEFADQPEIAASLYTTIGNTYFSLGLFDTSETHLQKALSLRLEIFGRENNDVATSQKDLGKVLLKKGEIASAEPLFRESLATMRRLHGNKSLEFAETLYNLSLLLIAKGQQEKGVSLLCEDLEIRRSLFGEIHPDVARTLGEIANTFGMMGDREKAVLLQRKSLSIMRQFYEGDHPDVAESISMLATAILLANPDEAENLFYETLAMRRRMLGNEHPDVAWTLYRLSFLMHRQGRFIESENFAREVLSFRGETLHD